LRENVPPAIEILKVATGSVGVAIVFFTACGKQDANREDGDDDRDDEKRGRDVHGGKLLGTFRT
jgi:hypothetical protein